MMTSTVKTNTFYACKRLFANSELLGDDNDDGFNSSLLLMLIET